jgi:hypothetical protein
MDDDSSPMERDPAVDEFLDGLDERIGKRGCPICGEDGWISVPSPGYLPVGGLATMKVAYLVSGHCYFVRSHVIDPEWHDAISASRTEEDPSSSS